MFSKSSERFYFHFILNLSNSLQVAYNSLKKDRETEASYKLLIVHEDPWFAIKLLNISELMSFERFFKIANYFSFEISILYVSWIISYIFRPLNSLIT